MAVTIKGFASDWSVPAGAKDKLDKIYNRKGELVINVRDFGATGDGDTNDIEAIRAAAAALPQGGVLLFPPGKYYVDGPAIALTVTCSVEGQSGGAYAGGNLNGSVIFNKMGNTSPFTSTADGVWFRHLYFISFQSQPTVHANQCTAITFLSGNDCGVEKCTFSGWYQWMDFRDGSAHTIRDNRCSLASKYGVRIRNLTNPDNGDSVMTGNLFISNDPWQADALVRQESSGGLKVFGNKFLSSTGGAARFLDVAISDGAETSILTVTGNSFEYARVSAIRLTLAGPLNTGSFGKINITGNQFTANGMTGAMIDIDNPGGPTKMQEITVSANTAWGHQTFPVGGYVKLQGVNVANVTGNQFRGGPLGVDIGDRSYNVMVDKSNFFHEVAVPIRGRRVPDRISFPSNALVEIDAPRAPAPTLTPSTTGGTMAAGTYTYAVAYRDGAGLLGQLGDSANVTTTGDTGSVAMTWAGWPALGTAARVYRGTGGVLSEYRDVSGATMTDNGAGWTSGTHPGTSTYPAVRLGAMSSDPVGSGGKSVGWIMSGQLGIGTRFPQSDFHVEGSMGLRVDNIGSPTGDHGITDTNCVVIFTAMSANRNVWLPTAVNKKGRVLTIKDGSGQAGTYTINVAANVAGQTVDGGPSVPLNTPYGTVRLVSNGSNWFTI